MIPCKTFLVGEYAVLSGGEAIGLATGPGFTITTEKFNYHAESAAALFLQSQEFYKVHSSAPGGFGKSTAEFIFAYLSRYKSATDFKTILQSYLSLFDKNPAQRPSGADLVIQCLGGVTHIKTEKAKSVAGVWPFENLGFVLVSTGLKIATHEHLKNLNRDEIRDLPILSGQVVSAFLKADQNAFFDELTVWKRALESKGLTHPDVLSLMANLNAEIGQKLSSTYIIKQCGAFGADVIIIIFEKNQKEVIKNIVKKFELVIVAAEDEITDGALSFDDKRTN